MCWFLSIRSFFSFLKDAIPAVSWATGAIFAYKGLQVWRAQMTGKDKYDIAKNLLKTIYNVREKIGYLRKPMMMGGEIESSMRKHFPDNKFDFLKQTAEDEKRIERAVMTDRWSEVMKIMVDYRVIKFEAIVHWGKPIEEAFGKFEKVIHGLKIKVDMLPRLKKNAADGTKENFSNYIFDLGDEAIDDFGKEFNSAITDIEKIIRPSLK